MELSVIIVSYNVRHFLEQCLLSVCKASKNIDCEVFVVDNNSADGSCSMVSSEFPGVRLIMNRVNRGFSAANNQALKLASGRFILLLNPDTIVEEDTFNKCILFMESHPDAGAVGVRMINGKGRFLPESKRGIPDPKTAFFKMIGLSYLFPKSEQLNRYYLGHLDNRKTTKAEIISGAFMFLRRQAVLKTGFLDEDFFMYGEDVDYSYRILQAGFSNYYFPETKIIHFKGESTRKEDLNVFIAFYRAMMIFVRKHLNKGKSKGFIIPIQIAIVFRAVLSLIKQSLKRMSLAVLRLWRFLVSSVFPEIAGNASAKARNTIIVADTEGYSKVMQLISSTGAGNRVAGRVSLDQDDMKEEVLGNIEQLREVIRINRIREVIFTTGKMAASQIIDSMHLISDYKVTIRIASAGENYIVGSRYVNSKDDPVCLNRPAFRKRIKNWFRNLYR